MFLDSATWAMWSQISKRVVSLLKVGFLAMISLVTFVLLHHISNLTSSCWVWDCLLPILIAKTINHCDLETHI